MRNMADVIPGEFVWFNCHDQQRLPVRYLGRHRRGARLYDIVAWPSGATSRHKVVWFEDEDDPHLDLGPMSPLEQLAAAVEFDTIRANYFWDCVAGMTVIVVIAIGVCLGL